MKKGRLTVKAAIVVSVILAAMSFAGTAAAACVQPPSGMISWWGGDNNVLDIVGTNNGTLMGGATYAPGMVGQAFSFDGTTNSYVEIANHPGLNPTDAFTIEGWFYIDPNAPGNIGEVASLAAKTTGGVGDGGWFLWFQDSAAYTKALRFDILTWGSPAWPYAEVNNIITSAGWYHIAGVFDLASDPQAKLYVNGALAASSSSTVSAILNNSLPIRIGASHWSDAFGGNDRLNGKADEVEFFNRALSLSEIQAIYNAGSAGKCRSCTAPPSGMVSWWGGDNNALDMVGGNNGTLINGTSYAQGMVGKAFSFDGADDYVDMGNSNAFNFGSADFAISFWAKPENGGGGDDYDQIIGKAALNSFSPYQIGIHDSKWKFWSTSNGSSWDIALEYVFGDITLDSWQYIVITRAGNAIKFYINGVQTATITSSSELWSNNEKLLIGKTPWTAQDTHFNGLIDEIAIFNRALSLSEIQAIYNAGSAGKCRSCTTPPSGMVSWWKAESSADDFFGLNNGTLQGGATFLSGKVGQAFSFDGEDGHILVPHSTSLDITGAITMDAWFKLDELADSGIIIKGDANGTIPLSSYSLGVLSDGKVYIGLYYGDTYDPYVSTDSLVSTDQWYHVAATWDGTTTNSDNVKLYLNGSLIQKWDKTTPLNSTTQPVTIGSMQGPTYYHSLKGLIDEVEIFNRALSAEEIAAAYNAGSAGVCTTSYAITVTPPAGNGAVSCTASVLQGYPAVCTIMPDTGYYLSGLLDNAVPVDIAGSVINGTYTIPGVTEGHTVEATFSEYMIKRVSSLLNDYYNLLTEAFEEVVDSDTLMLRQGTFAGSAYNRTGVSITLKGGYNTGFGSNAGQFSMISGPVTISSGTVTVENVTIL